MSAYTVHLCPPDYPAGCFPGRCEHEPQFVMTARAWSDRSKRGAARLVIEHSVCLACGLTRPCTYGGNVLVDLHQLWEEFGWHAAIGGRVIALRHKWLRIASYLFDESGWNGKHERIARLIDPNLTMRMRIEETGQPVRFAHVSVDESYMREAA